MLGGLIGILAEVLGGGAMTHAALVAMHFGIEALGRKKLSKSVKASFARGVKWCDESFDVEHYPLDETGVRALLPDPSTIPVPKSTTAPITGKPKAAPPPEKNEEETAGEMKSGAPPYPVLRFCATEAQFQKYGQSPRGVVGWFSPSSKELVVFLGGDDRMGKGTTEAVVYHEGWHQYANSYFDNPARGKSDALHRWFDEGHGDYFGGFKPASGKWRYAGAKMRGKTIERLVKLNRVPSLKKLVEWPRSQFYGQNSYITLGQGANQGDSGGPVFNTSYEVVGVMVAMGGNCSDALRGAAMD